MKNNILFVFLFLSSFSIQAKENCEKFQFKNIEIIEVKDDEVIADIHVCLKEKQEVSLFGDNLDVVSEGELQSFPLQEKIKSPMPLKKNAEETQKIRIQVPEGVVNFGLELKEEGKTRPILFSHRLERTYWDTAKNIISFDGARFWGGVSGLSASYEQTVSDIGQKLEFDYTTVAFNFGGQAKAFGHTLKGDLSFAQYSLESSESLSSTSFVSYQLRSGKAWYFDQGLLPKEVVTGLQVRDFPALAEAESNLLNWTASPLLGLWVKSSWFFYFWGLQWMPELDLSYSLVGTGAAKSGWRVSPRIVLERLVYKRWSLRVEAFAELLSTNFDFTNISTSATSSGTQSVTTMAALLGVGYHF